MSNPGSTSASSGNARSNHRQNASIVETAISPRRPYRPRQAARSASSSDIVFAADGRDVAGLAVEHIIGPRRELAAGDGVDRVRETLLRPSENRSAGGVGKERHDPFRTLEGQVDRLADDPS